MLSILLLESSFAATVPSKIVWIVPVVLALGSVLSFALAVRRGVSWRMMRFWPWPLAVWMALAALASSFAVGGVLDYNTVAGTDKTSTHIIQISAAVLAGPMVGPVANSAATNEIPDARRWTAILAGVLFAACSPFLFVHRLVSPILAVLCWTLFISGTLLWFFGAMISMGVFLS